MIFAAVILTGSRSVIFVGNLDTSYAIEVIVLHVSIASCETSHELVQWLYSIMTPVNSYNVHVRISYFLC